VCDLLAAHLTIACLALGALGCRSLTFARPVAIAEDAGLADSAGPRDRIAAPDMTLDAGELSPPDAWSSAADAAVCGHCPPDQYCLEGECTEKPPLVTPALAACLTPPCIDVYNNCPVPLWTHAVATVPLDDGNVRRLDPGQQYQYAALPLFGGGRLYAYYKEPDRLQDRVRLVSDDNQFVEMTVDTDASGAFVQNYNISYVDYASLPVWMKADGNCRETKCGTRFDIWTSLLRRCPTELGNVAGDLGTCLGSYNYCLGRDAAGAHDDTRPYCRKMRDAHGYPGSAVYGGVFPDHPATDVAFWDQVAAWNRGVPTGDGDDDHYYRTPPFNDYAGWIHRELACLDVYGFSTDDHQDKAGFVRCASPRLDVIWCPYRARLER
jgi:hypothetical protein